jgi:hypothetical protein
MTEDDTTAFCGGDDHAAPSRSLDPTSCWKDHPGRDRSADEGLQLERRKAVSWAALAASSPR